LSPAKSVLKVDTDRLNFYSDWYYPAKISGRKFRRDSSFCWNTTGENWVLYQTCPPASVHRQAAPSQRRGRPFQNLLLYPLHLPSNIWWWHFWFQGYLYLSIRSSLGLVPGSVPRTLLITIQP